MVKKNKKTRKMIEFIKDIVPVLALGVTLIIYVRTSRIEHRLNKLNYSPQLIVSECNITDFKINRLATTQYIVTAETKLKNIGNNNARLLMHSNAVLATGEDYFRQLKDSINFREELKDVERIYYAERQIYPSQILVGPTLKTGVNKIDIVTGISSADLEEDLLPTDSIFTLHFWFVYTNDDEIVYDTYYWYTTKITNDPKNPVQFVSQSYSFHIYDSKESKKIVAEYKQSKSLKRSSISF